MGSLIDDVTLHWPWPYDRAAIEQIQSMLPPHQAERSVGAIVKIARMSVLGRTAAGPAPPKPNIKAEVEAFRHAVTQARETAEALSPEALELLSRANTIPDVDLYFDVRFPRLLAELYRFESFDLMPEGATPPGAGTIEKPVGWVLHQLDLIFTQAHGGDRPSKGRPEFWQACLAPLAFEHVDKESRRKQLSGWRARRNWAEVE